MAGLRPAPADAFRQQQQQQPKQRPKRHCVGWRGGVGVRGRRKYVLVGRVYGVPRNRTHPAFDSCPRPVGTAFCDALGGCRPWSTRRSTPRVDALRSIVEIFDSDEDSSTHEVDPSDTGNLSEVGRCRSTGCQLHGPEACLGRAGQDAQPRSCRVRRTAHTSKPRPSLQGRTCGVPAVRHRPAIPRKPAVAVAVAVAVA